jgi:Domain of unknown function (DUF4178)
MSFENPTPVKIGMTGVFSGTTYRVLGRSVMGVVEDGETYYWDEFNLKSDSRQSATLVHELTERGSEWRWFSMFDPQFPITAADAATKRVGDPINLDGTHARITLRDSSRVYFIEGEGPEGEDVGDVAEYFNAESDGAMVVVSWTGEEVECYHGMTISSLVVGRAFNLPSASLRDSSSAATNSPTSSFPTVMVFSVLGAVILLALVFSGFRSRSAAPLKRFAAPSTALKVGGSGKIDGKNYTITSDALVELNEVGVVFQRHEFHLRDEDGNGALLIYGWKPGDKDWCLLTLRDPSEPMTPQQAAAVQSGQTVPFADARVPVDALFRFVALKVNTADILQNATGKVCYGFSGGTGMTLMLARWDEESVNFYEGRALNGDPTSAFSTPLEK